MCCEPSRTETLDHLRCIRASARPRAWGRTMRPNVGVRPALAATSALHRCASHVAHVRAACPRQRCGLGGTRASPYLSEATDPRGSVAQAHRAVLTEPSRSGETGSTQPCRPTTETPRTLAAPDCPTRGRRTVALETMLPRSARFGQATDMRDGTGAVPTIPANATHSRGEASQPTGVHTGGRACGAAPLTAASKLKGVER
jgi:hypothetical protein